jgi:GNAT superfamily N-acetyltransferase
MTAQPVSVLSATDQVGEALVRRILMADPIWAAYAIADLQPAAAPYCHWLAAQTTEGDGLALLYTGLEPPVLLTAGAPAAVAVALFTAELPAEVYVSIREEHVPQIAKFYPDRSDHRPMWRMRLAAPEMLARAGSTAPVRLRRRDTPRILQLFDHGGPFCPDAFAPEQLDEGVFYGVEAADGALAAVGGTHIVDWTAGVAAIGNMYTRPDARRRGHAQAVLASIVQEVQSRGAQTVVLNVDQRNTGAQQMYLRHGFAVHTPYVEGVWRRDG